MYLFILPPAALAGSNIVGDQSPARCRVPQCQGCAGPRWGAAPWPLPHGSGPATLHPHRRNRRSTALRAPGTPAGSPRLVNPLRASAIKELQLSMDLPLVIALLPPQGPPMAFMRIVIITEDTVIKATSTGGELAVYSQYPTAYYPYYGSINLYDDLCVTVSLHS